MPQPPLRIVPVTDKLLTMAKEDKKITLQVRGASPHATVMFATGKSEGISTIENNLPVPIQDGHVIGKAKCDETGAFDFHLPATSTESYAVAITIPAKGSPGKKLISYPIKLQ
jgi:hypothetical protein